MLAGVWLMLIYMGFFAAGMEPTIARIAAVSGGVLAVTHYWATTWTVVGSPVFAEARRRRPWEMYVLPGLIMVGSIALGVEVVTGQTFEPGEGFGLRHWAFGLYIASFIAFHFFHFAQQDFGVLSLYRHRAKQFSPMDRKVDLFLARFLTMVCLPVIGLAVFSNQPFNELIKALIPFEGPGLDMAADVAFVGAMVAIVGAFAFELRKPNASFPKLLYMVVIGLHPLTLYMANTTAYALVYVHTHWLIAIALSWRINRNQNVASARPARAWSHYALGFGGIVLASLFIHATFEQFALFDNAAFRDHVGRADLLMGLVAGFALGEALTHYYYDRVLFRFADPYVRENVGPLLH